MNKICSHIQKLIRLSKQKTHGKQPRQILAENSHGKFLGQISKVNSPGAFPREILKYAIQKMVEKSSVQQSFTREDKKKTSNKARAMRINLVNQ